MSGSRKSASKSRGKASPKSGGVPPVTAPPPPTAIKTPPRTPEPPGGAAAAGMHNAQSQALLKDMGGDPSKLRVRADLTKSLDKAQAAVEEAERVFKHIVDTFKPKEAFDPSALKPLVAILTTAPPETLAFASKVKSSLQYWRDGDWIFYYGVLPGPHPVPVVSVKSSQGSSGTYGSSNATRAVIKTCPFIQAIFATGVAWGVPRPGMQLCDVLVSSVMLDYGHQRQGTDKSTDKRVVKLQGDVHKLSSIVTAGLSGIAQDWSVNPDPSSPHTNPTRAHVGLVVSWSVLLDNEDAVKRVVSTVTSHVSNDDRYSGLTLIGGEMEGVGLMDVAREARVPCAIVKSVVDFGDGAKTKAHQAYGAWAAMEYVADALTRAQVDWVRRLLPMNDFLSAKRADFIGRIELMKRVTAWKYGKGITTLVITGKGGVGKSSFLAKFHHDHPDDVMGVHVCRFGQADTLGAREWIESLGWQVSRWARANGLSFPATLVEEALDSDTRPGSIFKSMLRALPRERLKPGWIIVDSMDEALGVGTEIVDAIAEAGEVAPPWVRLLVSSRKDGLGEQEGPIKRLLASPGVAEDGPNAKENAADIGAWLKQQRRHWSKANVDAVVKASEGNFLYARTLLQCNGLEQLVRGSLPVGLPGAYDLLVKQMWPDQDDFEKDIVPVLSALCAADSGLSPDMLRAAAKTHLKARRVPTTVRELSEKGLVEVAVDESVRVFHLSLADWIREAGGTARFQSGADALWKACCDERAGEVSVYSARYGITHGVEAGKSKKEILAGIACRVRWGALKYETGHLSEVKSDLAACGGAVPVAKAMEAAAANDEAHAADLRTFGWALWRLAEYPAAQIVYMKAKSILEKMKNTESKAFASTLNNIAILYESMGKLDDAEKFYRQALDLKGRTSGKVSKTYASSLMGLAQVLSLRGKHDAAVTMYEESLVVKAKTVGKTKSYANSLSGLANVLVKLGKYEAAEAHYKEALDIKERTVGKGASFSSTLRQLAGLYEAQGRLDEAEKLLAEALRITDIVLGAESLQAAANLLAVAKVKESKKDKAGALARVNEYLALCKKLSIPVLPEAQELLKRVSA